MPKINVFLKKNKKIIKWIFYDIIIIAFCFSVIINITYLPKYWKLKHHIDTSLKITIWGYDDANKQFLFDFNYETNMVSLGDLMANFPKTYGLKNTGLGHELDNITFYNIYNNSWTTLHGTTQAGQNHWLIRQNNVNTTVGIDGLTLTNNEVFELYYTKG